MTARQVTPQDSVSASGVQNSEGLTTGKFFEGAESPRVEIAVPQQAEQHPHRMAPGAFGAIRKACTVGVELGVFRRSFLEGFAGEKLDNAFNRGELASTQRTFEAGDSALKRGEVIGASDVDARGVLPIHKARILTSL